MTRFRAKVWVAAAAALIVALSQAGAGGAEPPKLTQPVQATKGDDNPLRTYSGPAMAVDPGDPLRVVASFVDMRTRRCGLLRSTDGGKTWRLLDASPALESYPSCLSTNSSIFHGPIAFGRNGSLYYALSGWDVQDRQGGEVSSAYNSSVQLGRSKDLGDTWETTLVRNARGKQGTDFEGNRPLTGIAVDTKNGTDDIVYVAWRRELSNNVSPNAVPRVPMVAVSSDGGRTFADPVDLAKGVFDSPSVRADALKTVTTLAGTNTTTTLGPAGSKAGQPDQADNFGGGNPAIALDGKGNVYADRGPLRPQEPGLLPRPSAGVEPQGRCKRHPSSGGGVHEQTRGGRIHRHLLSPVHRRRDQVDRSQGHERRRRQPATGSRHPGGGGGPQRPGGRDLVGYP
ncbi:MAG: glycoside hydrolase [Actinobacteria bacterium]|nr:glycoside hydrolase [Actinomycetota bacterium]